MTLYIKKSLPNHRKKIPTITIVGILGVFQKTPKLNEAPHGHFFLYFKYSGVFYNLLGPEYQKNQFASVLDILFYMKDSIKNG